MSKSRLNIVVNTQPVDEESKLKKDDEDVQDIIEKDEEEDVEEAKTGVVIGKIDDNMDMDQVATLFAEFARGYPDIKAAINEMPMFLEKVYIGEDLDHFRRIARRNYILIAEVLAEKYKRDCEKAILSALAYV